MSACVVTCQCGDCYSAVCGVQDDWIITSHYGLCILESLQLLFIKCHGLYCFPSIQWDVGECLMLVGKDRS